MTTAPATRITTPSDREIAMSRVFNAPRAFVYEAHTRPELMKRWLLGPPGWSMPVCEIDLRVGGSYRYVWRRDSDGSEMGVGGVYREIVPHERLVATERFIGDLLDAARMESGHFSVHPTPADIGAVLREACHVFAHRAAARNARVECDVPADIPPAAADRDRIAQLVGNLLDNALRYTPAGESIRVTAREVGRFVEVSVADRGPGVSPEGLQRLFDAFWKANPGAGAGAGLGLAICKGIVEAHGGTISAESDVSRGTTIRFTLPVASR